MWALGLVSVASSLVGCAKPSPAVSAPAAEAESAPSDAREDLAGLEAELAEGEAELRRLGVRLEARAEGEAEVAPAEPADAVADEAAASTQAPAPDAGTSPRGRVLGREGDDRCVPICELAQALCGLESRICALAEGHPGEARFADACGRARRDCALGEGACRDCSP